MYYELAVEKILVRNWNEHTDLPNNSPRWKSIFDHYKVAASNFVNYNLLWKSF